MTSIDPRPLKRGRRTATPEDFERLGGEIMERTTDGGSAAVFDARFIAFFGVVCAVVADVWNRLVEKSDPELESASPFHLLWALLFLKQYPTETVFCKLVGVRDEGTVRHWSQLFVRHIGYLVLDVVGCGICYCWIVVEELPPLLSYPHSRPLLFSLLAFATDKLGEPEAR
jgi:hypothetical protein